MIIKQFFFLILLINVVYSNVGISQTLSFDNPQYIIAKEQLKNFIIEAYKDDKQVFYEGSSFKEKKEIKALLLDRKNRTLQLLEDNLLIINGPLYDYVNSIFIKIAKANPSVSVRKIIIVKTEDVNAFTAGEGIIYVNLGLLYRIQSEEQLAFILCHEFSHDKLKHFEKNVQEYVSDRTDKEKDKKIREILKNGYNHVTNLNRLLIPDLIADKNRRRDCEFDADSVGMKMYVKTGYNPILLKSAFDLLKNSKHEVDTLDFDFKSQFKLSSQIIDLDKLLIDKYESSLGSFDESTDESIKQKEIRKKEMRELLRSHPYENERVEKLSKDYNIVYISENDFTSNSFKINEKLIKKELLTYLLQTQQLGRIAFAFLVNEKKNDNDVFFTEAIILTFLNLQHAKQRMNAGVLLGDPSDYYDQNYNSLINLLGKLSPNECSKIANNYYSQLFQSNTLNFKMIRLFLFYFEKKNKEFTTFYEVNKELFTNSIFNKISNQLYLEVKNRN
jgi:hypothetical protein